MKTREPAKRTRRKTKARASSVLEGVHMGGEIGVHWAEKTQQQECLFREGWDRECILILRENKN